MSLPSARPNQSQTGYWGDHDGTIDFCEQNYDHTFWIAEFVNTLSNLVIVLLSIHGVIYARRARLPTRVLACYAGQSLIGIGSTLFHATLQHKFQVLDEVPMLWVTSLLGWCAFETTEGYGNVRYISPLSIGLVIFNLLATLSCMLQWSPTIHEVAFGLLVTLAAFRIFYLLFYALADLRARQPETFKEAGRLFAYGIGSFLLGFGCWNADNLLCETHLQPWRAKLGYPAAYLLEGHAYWHLGTGVAPYFCITGATFLMLSLKEPRQTFSFGRSPWGLPIIVRRQSATAGGTSTDQDDGHKLVSDSNGGNEKPSFADVVSGGAGAAGGVRQRSSVSPTLGEVKPKGTL